MAKFKAGDRIKRTNFDDFNAAVPKEAVVKFVGDAYYLVDAVVVEPKRSYEQPLFIQFVDGNYELHATFRGNEEYIGAERVPDPVPPAPR